MRLLARAACFTSGEPIPYTLLIGTVHANQLDFANRIIANEAVNRLIELGLVRSEGQQMVLMHMLVADFVRHVSRTTHVVRAQRAVERTLLAEAERHNKAGYPEELRPWQSHLRTVTAAAQKAESRWGARLGEALARHLRQTGDYAGAYETLVRAITIWRALEGEKSPATARCLSEIGHLLLRQAELGAAQVCYEQALAAQLETLGEMHADTAQTLNNIGYLLQVTDKLAEARPYHERALRIRQMVLKGGQEVAQSLSNLAFLHYAAKEWEAASRYLALALKELFVALGEEHPETLRVLQYVGELEEAQGRWEAAAEIYDRVLRMRQRVLGPGHPETARILDYFGCAQLVLGKVTEARTCIEEALKVRRAVLGPNHPLTADSYHHMGDVHLAVGEKAAAIACYSHALHTLESSFAKAYPQTEAVRQKLANLTSDQPGS